LYKTTHLTHISTLSLHDALPISDDRPRGIRRCGASLRIPGRDFPSLQSSESVEFFLPHPLNPQSAICDPQSRLLLLLFFFRSSRSEEHTSELQSRENLVCRLLLE